MKIQGQLIGWHQILSTLIYGTQLRNHWIISEAPTQQNNSNSGLYRQPENKMKMVMQSGKQREQKTTPLNQ